MIRKQQNRNLNYIRKLSEQAESRGITLAVKPHIASSIYNIATTIQMLDEIDSPALGVNLDLLQIYKGGEDPAEAVLKFGKKIVHSHFHDAIKALRFVPRQALERLGRKKYPGEATLIALKSLGVSRIWVMIKQLTSKL